MTNIEFLKEIEAWLSFNTEPSKEETAKLRKSIKDHLTEQLRLGGVSNSVCDCCVPSPEDPFEYENPICRKCGCAMKQTDC